MQQGFNVLIRKLYKFYVCAVGGVIIEYLDNMHGVIMKTELTFPTLNCYHSFMEHIQSLEASSFSASQDILLPQYFIITRSRHLSPSCAKMNQSQPWSCFLKMPLNITFPPTPSLPSGLYSSGFPITILYARFISPILLLFPDRLILNIIPRKCLVRSRVQFSDDWSVCKNAYMRGKNAQTSTHTRTRSFICNIRI